MNVDNYTTLETYKGIEKRTSGLGNIFAELKFNQKKPKYNYHSGLLAGMMVNNLVLLRPILKAKGDQDIIEKILSQIIPMAQDLVSTYNWNLGDLTNLAEQFFGDES